MARTVKSSIQLCHGCAAAAALQEAVQAAAAAVCLPVHCEQHAETISNCCRCSSIHGKVCLLLVHDEVVLKSRAS